MDSREFLTRTITSIVAIAVAVISLWGSVETTLSVPGLMGWLSGAIGLIYLLTIAWILFRAPTREISKRFLWVLYASLLCIALQMIVGAIPQPTQYGFRVLGFSAPMTFALAMGGAVLFIATQIAMTREIKWWVRVAAIVVILYGALSLQVEGPLTDRIENFFAGHAFPAAAPTWLQGGPTLIWASMPLAILLLLYSTLASKRKRNHTFEIGVALWCLSTCIVAAPLLWTAFDARRVNHDLSSVQRLFSESLRSLPAETTNRELLNEIHELLARDAVTVRQVNDMVTLVSDALDHDKARIVEWVTQSIRPAPYEGVLKGPQGTLLDGSGSSIDRTLLVLALLKDGEFPVSIGSATLTDYGREKLLTRTTSAWSGRRPRGPESDPADDAFQEREGLQFFNIEFEEVRDAHEKDRITRAREQQRISEAIDAHLAELLRAMPDAPPHPAIDDRIESIVTYSWPRIFVNDSWHEIDLDGLLAEKSRTLVAQQNFDLSNLPNSYFHMISLGFNANLEGPSERIELLEKEFRSIDIASHSIDAFFLPSRDIGDIIEEIISNDRSGDRDGRLSLAGSELRDVAWSPVLSVDGKLHVGTGVRIDGSTAISSGIRAPGSKATDVLGGVTELFGELSGKESSEAESGDRPGQASRLHSIELSIAIRSPSRTDRHIRTLLTADDDSAGKFDEARGIYALLARYSLLAQSARTAPYYPAEILARNALKYVEFLESVQSLTDDVSVDDLLGMLGGVQFDALELHTFASVRFALAATPESVLIDEPNVVLLRRAIERMPDGNAATTEFDIVSNRVAVLDPDGDAGTLSIRQGVADTFFESYILEQDPAAVRRSGVDDLIAAGTSLFAGRDERVDVLRLDAETMRNCGIPDKYTCENFVLLAESGAIQPGSCRFWAVDGRTAQTLGIGPDGKGYAAVDYATFISNVMNIYGGLLTARDCVNALVYSTACDIGGCVGGIVWAGVGFGIAKAARSFPWPGDAEWVYAHVPGQVAKIVRARDIAEASAGTVVGAVGVLDMCVATIACPDSLSSSCYNPADLRL